jgi:hypothetical protein
MNADERFYADGVPRESSPPINVLEKPFLEAHRKGYN